jgi:heptosyltransferase-2
MPACEKIVVFLPNWIGDVVMATPALRGLRGHFASARVAHVGKPAAMEVLAGLGLSDESIVYRPGGWSPLAELIRLAWRVRRGRYDLAVLLPNSFRVALMAAMAGVGRLAGYARDGRGWLLDDAIAPPRDTQGGFLPVSAVDYYIALAESLGARCDDRRIRLAATEADRHAAEAVIARAGLDGRGLIVMLNPGAAFGGSKMWHPTRFAALADAMIEQRGAAIIINAAPPERAIARQVAEAMRHKPAINLAEVDNSIGLVKGLLLRCDLLVTNDTGARHIAAGLGVPVVTVFGSTDPRWSAIEFEMERTVRLDVPCSPCQKPLCPQPPGPAYHQCMETISPELVLSKALELVDRRPCPEDKP